MYFSYIDFVIGNPSRFTAFELYASHGYNSHPANFVELILACNIISGTALVAIGENLSLSVRHNESLIN